METLHEMVWAATTLSEPQRWQAVSSRIEAEHQHKTALLSNGAIPVYGANTLTGHRDGENVEQSDVVAYQYEILDSHAIATAPFYDDSVARHITFAKLYNLCAGGSGVSPALFSRLRELALSADFTPLVPRHASYSSGDVIPAAHWAREMLNWRAPYTPEAGEVMALINGNFVVLGRGAELVFRLCDLVRRSLDNTARMLFVTHCDAVPFHVEKPSSRCWVVDVFRALEGWCVAPLAGFRQKSVSLRATPQVVQGLCDALDDWLCEINRLLTLPSGNPLFDPSHPAPLSQASFLTPVLSVKTGSLIEHLLLFAWAATGRTQFLLSGEVSGVPRDASTGQSRLSLIQYPKLMTACLEEARMIAGRRVFASGASTSYGIEDIWTQSLTQLDQLNAVIELLGRLTDTEGQVLDRVEEMVSTSFPEAHFPGSSVPF